MIEIVRGTTSRYDRETKRYVVERHAYVVVDGKRLSDEESRAVLTGAYDAAGVRSPVLVGR